MSSLERRLWTTCTRPRKKVVQHPKCRSVARPGRAKKTPAALQQSNALVKCPHPPICKVDMFKSVPSARNKRPIVTTHWHREVHPTLNCGGTGVRASDDASERRAFFRTTQNININAQKCSSGLCNSADRGSMVLKQHFSLGLLSLSVIFSIS